MREMDIAVENVILSAVFPHTFNINAVAEALPGARRQPGKFPALVYRFARPAATFLIFDSGKAICTGAKSEEEAILAVKKFVEILRQRIPLQEPKVTLENIVVSASLERKVNVERLAAEMGLSYEPEKFPGASVKLGDKTILVFSSGRLVCVGSKSLMEASQTIHQFKQMLASMR